VVKYKVNYGKVDEIIICPNNCNDLIVVTGNTAPLEYKIAKPSNTTVTIPTDKGEVSFLRLNRKKYTDEKLLKFGNDVIKV